MSSKLLAEPTVEPHFPLAASVWPERTGRASRALRAALLIALGTALSSSAKINLPLPYVPMTLQTLVVLDDRRRLWLASRRSTVIAYLAEGAMGLPVFAGPIGGTRAIRGADGRLSRRICARSLGHGRLE